MRNARKNFRPGDIPRKPGVYIFRDRFGKVIYIGKAADLRKRMSQYFQPSRKTSSDPRLRSMINSIADWELIAVRDESESLLLEARLIKQYAPKYNVLLRDDKRYLLIKINPREKYPKIRLARIRKNDGQLYFGPFPRGGALRETAEFLTRYFGLRSCSPAMPDASTYKRCLSGIVRDCCRPCIGEVSREEYLARVDNLIEVLEGKRTFVLDELEEKMREYSEKKKFEKAALIRDVLANIADLFRKNKRNFRFASIPSVPGHESVRALALALKMKRLPERISAMDISNIGGEMAVGSVVTFENGKPDKSGYRRYHIKTVDGSNDFAMMQELARRYVSRLIDEQKTLPGLLLVDGGKGQLNAVLRTLVDLGSGPAAVAGLAKKKEEVFLPGRPEPVVLDRRSPALKLLQAVRDESHRFAVGFHRKLRERRIRESVLDEIEGVGPERKKNILKAFGSLAKLRGATPELIRRKVPGVGPELARKIAAHMTA